MTHEILQCRYQLRPSPTVLNLPGCSLFPVYLLEKDWRVDYYMYLFWHCKVIVVTRPLLWSLGSCSENWLKSGNWERDPDFFFFFLIKVMPFLISFDCTYRVAQVLAPHPFCYLGMPCSISHFHSSLQLKFP